MTYSTEEPQVHKEEQEYIWYPALGPRLIKVRLEFLFKNVSVCYHPKVIRQTVPFCRSREKEGTFSEFCTQSG